MCTVMYLYIFSCLALNILKLVLVCLAENDLNCVFASLFETLLNYSINAMITFYTGGANTTMDTTRNMIVDSVMAAREYDCISR
jgi:hypothetical protein